MALRETNEIKFDTVNETYVSYYHVDLIDGFSIHYRTYLRSRVEVRVVATCLEV